MKVISPGLQQLRRLRRPSKTGRASRFMATITLISFAGCCLIPLNGCKGQSFSIGPSTGEVVGAVIGTVAVVGGTTAILIAVHHSHHTVKGCVSSGPEGFQVATDDKKTYLLTGSTPNLKTGEMVKFHGNKMKKLKSGAGYQTFAVETVVKDYGPCKVVPASTAKAATPSQALGAD